MAYGWFIFGVQVADCLEVAVGRGGGGEREGERGHAATMCGSHSLTITF